MAMLSASVAPAPPADVLTVEVCDVSAACQLLQFFDGANANDLLEVVRDPKRDRVAPVSVPGEAPVSGILQPVLEPLHLDPVRHPAWIVIVLK